MLRKLLPKGNPAPVMVLLVVAWGLSSSRWGEQLPRHHGFGWDGMFYRSIVLHLWERNEEVTMYHGMRCLPCVVIHYSLRALGLPLDDPHVFAAFRLYNLLWFVVILLALLSIAAELGIGVQGKWLIFLGLCCSYFHLKQAYYSPVVPDLWALGFCVLALRAYFKRQRLAVFAWVLPGSFTWAIVPCFGALLILFPYRGLRPHVSSALRTEAPPWPARVLAAVAAGLTAAFAAYEVWVQRFYGEPPAHFSHRAVPLSVACLAVYLYLAWREFPHRGLVPRWRDVASLDFLGRLGLLAGLVALLWIGRRLLQPYFSTRPLVPQHSLVLLRLICAYSVAKPFISLLAQVVYYGPAIILMVLFWRPMVHEARRQGAALVLALAAGLFLALSTETRYWMVFFPVFVVLLAKVLEECPLGFGRLAALVGLGLFMSKAWLPLNRAPWPPDEPFIYNDVFRFPMQAFFMNVGTWMTTRAYAIQAVVVAIITLVIKYRILPRLPAGGQARHPGEGAGQAALPPGARASA